MRGSAQGAFASAVRAPARGGARSRACGRLLRPDPTARRDVALVPPHPVLLHLGPHEPGTASCSKPFRALSTTAFLAAQGKKNKRSSKAVVTGSGEDAQESRYPPLPPGWQAVVGVECHAQIRDKSKLFSSADLPTATSAPNTLVTPFDAAHPGTLPKLNRSALRSAIRAALALGCTVHPESRFDRKHYFYPDLPSGYQITQKYAPLANNGSVVLSFDDGHLPRAEDEVVVEIEQLQLEQDTAKSTYFDTGTVSRADDADSSSSARSRSFVDLNRAGSGLMEIVSGPQLRTPEQAGAYVRKLQELLRRVGASDGNMQEGSLRCDVNVSVNRIGQPFGTRCEIKNLNSARFMMNAIAYESHRQVNILEQGGVVEQQTRGYDEARGTTFKLRGKEDAPDYRYMPDPNLPPIRLSQAEIEAIRSSLPELPDARRARLKAQYGLNSRDINVLMRVGAEDEGAGRSHLSTPSTTTETAAIDAVDYFEAVAIGRDAQTALNWIIHELLKLFNANHLAFSEEHVPAPLLGELIDLVSEGRVTGTTARTVLAELVTARTRTGETASAPSPPPRTLSMLQILTERGLLALTGREQLLPLCREAIEALPEEADKVRGGNVKVAMRIVGRVMKSAQGRADAKLVHQTVLEELGQA